jgi:hypothetical protein
VSRYCSKAEASVRANPFTRLGEGTRHAVSVSRVLLAPANLGAIPYETRIPLVGRLNSAHWQKSFQTHAEFVGLQNNRRAQARRICADGRCCSLRKWPRIFSPLGSRVSAQVRMSTVVTNCSRVAMGNTMPDLQASVMCSRWLDSSFTYKGRAVDVKQVGRKLGVRYLLEGSVRKSDTLVARKLRLGGRLSHQCLDCPTALSVKLITQIGQADFPFAIVADDVIVIRRTLDLQFSTGGWVRHYLFDACGNKRSHDGGFGNPLYTTSGVPVTPCEA